MAEPTIEPTPEATPDLELLYLAEEARKQGLLDQLTPAEKAKLLQKIEAPMKAQREQVLEATPAKMKEPGFLENLSAPVRSMFSAPVETALSAARGIARASNPAPIVNLLTPTLPHIPDDLETIEGLLNFPIIRGAELASRMFVNEEDRPPLTTFAEVVKGQQEMDQHLRKMAPGWQEGSEAAIVVGSGMSLVSSGLKYAAQLARKAPLQMRKAAGALAQIRAERATRKTLSLAKEHLRLSEGDPLVDAIIRRPERIEQLVKDSSNISINDVAIQLKDELEGIGAELGDKVGKYREAAFKDTVTRMQVPENVAPNIQALRQRTTFQGKSILPRDIDAQLESSAKAAQLGVTTPNQAMVWVDMLDGIIDYGQSGKPGSTAIKNANNTLMAIRGEIKNMLRSNNVTWAAADDAFSGFIGESDGLIRRLESDTGESLVANLFGKNKTPLRNRLEKALDYMERIDPTARGAGEAFFSRLADIKAAKVIQGVRFPEPGNRVAQQATIEIVKRWTRRGEDVGTAVGSIGGFLLGGSGGGGLSSSAVGGGVGFLALKGAGARAGEWVGSKMADPMRVLNAAKKAKTLSAEARSLAADMGTIVQHYGPAGGIAFLDLIKPIPAVKELIKFANQRENKQGGPNAQ